MTAAQVSNIVSGAISFGAPVVRYSDGYEVEIDRVTDYPEQLRINVRGKDGAITSMLVWCK